MTESFIEPSPPKSPQPVKIALSFPGCHRRGGVERVVVECANFLAERGHETHVFAHEWDETTLHQSVIKHAVPETVSRTSSTRSSDARSSAGRSLAWRSPTLQIPRFTRASWHQIDAIRPAPHSIGSFGIYTPPDGVVWMQSVHRAWIEVSQRERNFQGRLKQRLNPFHTRVLALEKAQLRGRHYRHVIALTEQVKRDTMRFYDVPENDITIIPNGYAPHEFNLERRQERDAVRQRFGFKPDDKVLIFVANELERKGFFPLLNAIAALQNPTLHLLAVGRLDVAACANEIARLGLGERVHFTGASSDVAAFYAASDIFVLPTQYEPWGLVITEAMACGLPVLTSRLAGAAISVREGENGHLLKNPRDVEEIRAKLQMLVEGVQQNPAQIAASVIEYSWPRLLLKYEDVLLRYGTESKS